MKIQYILFIISGFIFFSACIPEPLEIEIPQLEPKVVVASQFVSPQFAVVVLSKSFGALESDGDSLSEDFTNNLLLKNAQVTLNYNGQVDTMYEWSDGIYVSINTPQIVGATYTFHAVADTFEVYANSVMLQPVAFDSISPVVERASEDTTVSVYFSFEDLPGQNWYMVNYYVNSAEADTSTNLNSIITGSSSVLLQTDLISDQTFENGALYESQTTFPSLTTSDTLGVTISHISEDYYNFLVLRQRASNLFALITNEPINYPTNVEDGLGFFTTHYPNVRLFDLNNY